MDNGLMVMRVAASLVFIAGLLMACAESDVVVEILNFVGVGIMALGAVLMILIDREAVGYGTKVSRKFY